MTAKVEMKVSMALALDLSCPDHPSSTVGHLAASLYRVKTGLSAVKTYWPFASS